VKKGDIPIDQDLVYQAGIEKELATLEILLSSKVARTAITLEEFINVRLLQGASLELIKADLLKDLDEGGRIFGEFKNAIQPTFIGSTSRFRDIGEVAELGIEKKWRWVAVLVNTCPDCLERHNLDKTYSEWEVEGLPRTGATVCREHCKCVLIPEEIAKREPIKRTKA